MFVIVGEAEGSPGRVREGAEEADEAAQAPRAGVSVAALRGAAAGRGSVNRLSLGFFLIIIFYFFNNNFFFLNNFFNNNFLFIF